MDRDRVEVKSVRITFYWQTKNGLFSFTYNASFSLSHTHTRRQSLSLSHTHTHTHKTSISLSLPLSFSQFSLFQTFSYFVKYELEEVKVDTKIKNQEKTEWNLKIKDPQNLDSRQSYPISSESDELEQPHDPGRQHWDHQVEGAYPHPDAALEVLLVGRVVPVALVQNGPTFSERK